MQPQTYRTIGNQQQTCRAIKSTQSTYSVYIYIDICIVCIYSIYIYILYTYICIVYIYIYNNTHTDITSPPCRVLSYYTVQLQSTVVYLSTLYYVITILYYTILYCTCAVELPLHKPPPAGLFSKGKREVLLSSTFCKGKQGNTSLALHSAKGKREVLLSSTFCKGGVHSQTQPQIYFRGGQNMASMTYAQTYI